MVWILWSRIEVCAPRVCSSVGTVVIHGCARFGLDRVDLCCLLEGPHDFALHTAGVYGRLVSANIGQTITFERSAIGIPFFTEIEETEKNRRSALPYIQRSYLTFSQILSADALPGIPNPYNPGPSLVSRFNFWVLN